MKKIYLECAMGASGDMLMAALYALAEDKTGFIKKMNSLIKGVRVEPYEACKCAIAGQGMRVVIDGVEEESIDIPAGEHDHEHHHEHDHEHSHEHEHHHDHDHEHSHAHEHISLAQINGIIASFDIPAAVKKNALAVYGMLAEAEAQAHGSTAESVHFHEVGGKDAIIDITGVCLLMDMLAPEEIIASPVCTGYGMVKTSHGILPVPAPATASLLAGIPIYAGVIEAELCTPTGAALLRHFAARFERMPEICASRIGIGMGKKDFAAANCLRVYLQEAEAAGPNEQIALLACNIDDMSGEELAFAAERLFEGGALDVYHTPIYMKKGRPAVTLSCICRPAQANALAALMLAHTSTIGVRRTLMDRYALGRETETRGTRYGDIRIKKAAGYGVCKEKAEFDDIARAARKNNVTLAAVKKELK